MRRLVFAWWVRHTLPKRSWLYLPGSSYSLTGSLHKLVLFNATDMPWNERHAGVRHNAKSGVSVLPSRIKTHTFAHAFFYPSDTATDTHVQRLFPLVQSLL
jgi:hypothetical protein